MADMIKETAVVLVAAIDLAVAASLVAIVVPVWSNQVSVSGKRDFARQRQSRQITPDFQ
jgi:hypothetical protein